jgi:hypothetical protein
MEATALIRAVILLASLSGCATHKPPVVSVTPDCPASVPVPAPLLGDATAAKVAALQIRVELAREAERDRGDCWRAAALRR